MSNNLEHKVYCWWTGDNELSPNRKRSLAAMKKIHGDALVFINRDNLENYIVSGYPLHEGYKYLSEIQKGDYLKCYFMHHYGGGYSDIKQFRPAMSWKPYFDKLNQNNDLYAMGYPEKEPGHVAYLEDCRLDPKNSVHCVHNRLTSNWTCTSDGESWSSEHIRKNWQKLIGCGSVICKKGTPFTLDWWNGVNEKMDGYLEELKKYPSQWERDCYNHLNPKTGEKSKYPIPWAVLHGHVFHPLVLKYHKHIDQGLPYPVMAGYL